LTDVSLYILLFIAFGVSAARRQGKDACLLAVIENVITLLACPFGTQKESRRSADIHFFRLWIATP
jgi:hypothetical protein